MSNKYLTKKQALEIFKADILPEVVARYGLFDDKPAISEARNDYTDMLCKDGKISSTQYCNWGNPF